MLFKMILHPIIVSCFHIQDKIREYCLSLKPNGMKDDTSCSVLYLVTLLNFLDDFI